MIFLTVGTHEQQFNRLIENMDCLIKNKKIKEEVVMQTGFCTYQPKYCKFEKIISYDEMREHLSRARIIITHGGPSSFIPVMQIGKIPIVVPRQKQFKEHVNNHQVDFVKAIAKRDGNIIPIYQIGKLEVEIHNYEKKIQSISTKILSNNLYFNKELKKIVDSICIN